MVNETTAEHINTAQLVAVLSDADRRNLERSYKHLEHPSLGARLSSVIGTPIEIGLQLLPKHWYRRLHKITENSISKALTSAISTLHEEPSHHSSDGYHKALSIATGGAGGLFGLPALIIELPITTTLMLRSIADIARSHGEDLESSNTRLACMQVFALGGRTEEDDAAESGYYGVRLALSLSMVNARSQILQQGVAESPLIIKVVTAIAQRFGIQVEQKAAAQLVPVVGAVTGAAINVIFMQHFQQIAHAHFSIRALERKYGKAYIQAEYEKLGLADK